MKNIIALMAVLVSTPTIADVTSFQGPGGNTVYKTTCKMDEADCYQEAAATCGKSYQVLSSESHNGGLIVDLFPGGPIKYYSMNFACGRSDGQVAQFRHEGPYYYAPRPFYMECSNDYYNSACGGWR